MAALTGPKALSLQTIRSKNLVLAANQTAFRGDLACLDTSAHLVKAGAAGNANLVPVGYFEQDVTTGGSTGFVQVTLLHEIECIWMDNDTGANKVTSANLYQNVWFIDDHTASLNSTSNSTAGRVWDVDSVKGVLVQLNQWA